MSEPEPKADLLAQVGLRILKARTKAGISRDCYRKNQVFHHVTSHKWKRAKAIFQLRCCKRWQPHWTWGLNGFFGQKTHGCQNFKH